MISSGTTAQSSRSDRSLQRLLRSAWAVIQKEREVRCYSLTAKAHRQLALEQESWNRLTEGVGRVLRYA